MHQCSASGGKEEWERGGRTFLPRTSFMILTEQRLALGLVLLDAFFLFLVFEQLQTLLGD